MAETATKLVIKMALNTCEIELSWEYFWQSFCKCFMFDSLLNANIQCSPFSLKNKTMSGKKDFSNPGVSDQGRLIRNAWALFQQAQTSFFLSTQCWTVYFWQQGLWLASYQRDVSSTLSPQLQSNSNWQYSAAATPTDCRAENATGSEWSKVSQHTCWNIYKEIHVSSCRNDRA